MTSTPTSATRVNPVRLAQAPTINSPHAIMPRRNSLEYVQPYIYRAPYAHTAFSANDSFLVFGEGVVPPPPGSVQSSDAEEGESVTQRPPTDEEDEVSEKKVANGDQPEEEKAAEKIISVENDPRHSWYIRNKVLMAAYQAGRPSSADEMDDFDDLHPSPSLNPSSISATSTATPTVLSLTVRLSSSTLRPEIFLNPDELDQKMEIETYMYGLRGATSVSLRSNIQTVDEPALSEDEEMARNMERCKGMFGSLAEMSEDL